MSPRASGLGAGWAGRAGGGPGRRAKPWAFLIISQNGFRKEGRGGEEGEFFFFFRSMAAQQHSFSLKIGAAFCEFLRANCIWF